MMGSAKSQWFFWCLLPKFTRYSLTLLLSAVILADAVGATPRNRGLQIAQQPGTTQQNATRAAAERFTQEGMQLYQQGTGESLRRAIGKWQEALKLWQQLDDKGWEANILFGIGKVYSDLGEKQEALKYYNQALPIFRAVENREMEATTLNNIGGVYSDLGEKQEALKYYNQALPIYRAVEDKGGEANTLNNIGSVYSNLGEKQEALKYYNQALPIRRAVEDKGGEATTLSNIGSVYDSLGEKQEALKYYNQALPMRRAVEDKGGEATTLNNIGSVYHSLGENQEALKYYNQALPILRAVDDRGGEANTLNNIGRVYDDLGEKQEALKYYNQALPILRAVEDRGGEANTLNNIGLVHDSLGEKQEALKYLNQALPIRRAVDDRGGEAITLNNIGGVYSDLGENQEALKYYNQALPILRAVEYKRGEATTLVNMAALERDRGNFQQAQTHIQAAIEIVEDLRTKIASQELRTSYFATVQGYYRLYIDLLMQLHKKDPSKGYDALALHISERSRARILLELLTEANAKIRTGVDPKLLAEEQNLQQKLDAREQLRQELPNQAPTTVIQKLEKEIADLRSQYRELQTKIRTSSPKYAALKYPEPLKLAQIQQQLDSDTLLLQYSLGKERSYLWAVTPNSLDTYELPGSEQIEKATNNFRQSLVVVTNPKDTIKAATQLSQIILAPVAKKLGKKRLVIVADGALQNIPFAALTDLNPQAASLPEKKGEQNKLPSPNGGRRFNYQPLLINHEIVNLSSASTIAILRQETKGRKAAPKALAILADPVFTADVRVTGKPDKDSSTPELNLQRSALERSALERSAKNLNRNGWKRLDGTRQEAEAILRLVSPKDSLQAFDFDANYNWVTNPQLSQYRIIHFATHGFANTSNPELSGIVLSLVDKQGKPQRGYLRLNDIFNLNLPAELVVLSACETGLGKEVQGEGLVGLTRGLMYAGSQRLVVSLWKVNDEGTKELMSEFYRQMWQQGKSPIAALRDAQLYLWQQKDWQDPRYWAAFTLQGEWRNNS
ncbi:MAG: CHAT domain-containing protein [Nostoc sp. EfeVER01]|uniref:CHAT domain-containing protein n=2 Tax=unclassified Nostoc TaxID=2593658 RepID=UPI002AD1EC5E|nr:tetratricopeptide repeat protein [Nostoc sp. EfeVER01]MDZ7948849.1 tetratricopeptide repeat protein [Nostoc sp. EfeVER01]